VNGARWDEIDLEAGLWTLPPKRMKTKEPHIVPLSRQAAELLSAMQRFSARSQYVFPNDRWHHKPMSENAMSYLLRRAGLGGMHVPHGWRATFSTWANEHDPALSDIVEAVLAHVPQNRVRGAYNRASYLTQRKTLLQRWADLLLAEAKPLTELFAMPRRPLKARLLIGQPVAETAGHDAAA
jgi:integrase